MMSEEVKHWENILKTKWKTVLTSTFHLSNKKAIYPSHHLWVSDHISHTKDFIKHLVENGSNLVVSPGGYYG